MGGADGGTEEKKNVTVEEHGNRCMGRVRFAHSTVTTGENSGGSRER